MDTLGVILVLFPVVVGAEGVRGELKDNGTIMGIWFSLMQLSMIPLHRFVAPHLDHTHILPGSPKYDSRFVP